MHESKWIWVVFDTSQYQKYYRDVHDLLAMPRGWVFRYNYRETQMSVDALRSAASDGTKPIPALFVYAQKEVPYARIDNKSEFPNGDFSVKFVATRVGTMLNVVRNGDRYNFDFAVEEYPNQLIPSIEGILAPLQIKQEVPWDKWVTISDRPDLLSNLKSGDPAVNWTNIVEAIGNPPMQFAGDAFWRIEGPFKANALIKPKIEYIRNEKKIAQVRSYFLVNDRKKLRFQLHSRTGGPVAAARPQYEVHATSSQPKSLSVTGDGKFELRHYAEQSVDYESQAAPPLSSKLADLVFETKPDTPWPSGALLKLRHKIRMNYVVQFFGCLLGLAGMFFAITGASEFLKDDKLSGLLLCLLGAFLGVVAGFLLTGKLQFKS